MTRRPVQGAVLRVDPLLCEGVGLCARIAADAIDLDRWGYPIVGPLEPRDVAQAKRAVKGCPRRALWVEEPGPR